MKKLLLSVLLLCCLDLPARHALMDSLAQNLSLAEAEADYKKLKTIYRHYCLHYEEQGDYKNAYNYTLHYQQVLESLLSENEKAQVQNKKSERYTQGQASVFSGSTLQKSSSVLLAVALALIIVLLIARQHQVRRNGVYKQLLEEQGSYSRSIIEAEEKDRVRLVYELNNGIGQQISAARLNISALQSFLKTVNATDKLMLQNAVDILDDSVKEVRNVTQKMLPNVLVKAGLLEALKSYSSRLSSEATKINFESHGSFERTSSVKESVLYRVVIELINNALLHANASTLNVQVIRHDKELSIVVEDNGKGFDVDQFMKRDESYGLRSIQSRIDFLKGFIFFDSRPTKGTTVTMEIPL